MKIFGIAGWSGSGKTTLMVKLLPQLTGRGYSVSTMKHTHHNFDIDRPGKDSHEHRQAGATEVMIASSARWALLHELRGAAEPDMDALIARMTPVDLLLIEGFKFHRHAKLEVFRAAIGKPMLNADDPSVVAVASDGPLSGVRVPVFDMNDVAGISDFIVGYVGLAKGVRHGAA
jgi:molybdopterin-guanine dinucleotide biosynthesis protein B